MISVDTKKKELIDNFKNAGTTMEKEPIDVLDHDFRSDAEALAVPYGIYDLQQNQARMFLALSSDTSAFAVGALVYWWTHEGRRTYPGADHVLIFADSGGSNGARVRAWKFELQHKLCDRFGIGVTVCHYPSGASKWNPIEHRLFAQISRNTTRRAAPQLPTRGLSRHTRLRDPSLPSSPRPSVRQLSAKLGATSRNGSTTRHRGQARRVFGPHG